MSALAPLPTLTTTEILRLLSGVRGNTGLTKQSLVAAAVAAYVGALTTFIVTRIWHFQTAADATMCAAQAGNWGSWCAAVELFLTPVFHLLLPVVSDSFLALLVWPFAFLLTAPCALALGRLAPHLEPRLVEPSLSRAQYALGAAPGLAAGLLLNQVTAALLAAVAGVWIFRCARYGKWRSGRPAP